MKLTSLNPCVSIDQIVTRESGKYVHFITHLDQCLAITDDWQSKIYTSRFISEMLQIKKSPIPKKYLIVLDKNKEQSIKLPDGTTIRVRIFECGGLTGNIMLYFESETRRVIYSGFFLEYRSMFLNRDFWDRIQFGIDELYVDNIRARSTSSETLESVATTISNILNNHPGFTIMLNLPAFGYEDLIYLLASEYKFKVFVGKLIEKTFKKQKILNIFAKNAKAANILVGERCVTTDDLKRRLAQKRLTVHFINSYFDIESELKDLGLFLINWMPHPSPFDLYAFIGFVKPLEVHEIDPESPPLPKFLRSLCKRKNTTNPSKEVEIEANFRNQNITNPSKGAEIGTNDRNQNITNPSKEAEVGANDRNQNITNPSKEAEVGANDRNQNITNPSKETEIGANDQNQIECMSSNELVFTFGSVSQKRPVELPRNVISSKKKRYFDELTPRVAIVKPTIARNHDGPNDAAIAISGDDSNSSIISLYSCESLSITNISSSSAESNVVPNIFDENHETLIETLKVEPTRIKTNKIQDTTVHPSTSGRMIDQRRKTNVFAKRKPTVQYSSDDATS